MCLIATDRNLLSRIESWQQRFITQAGFETSEFLQSGTEFEPIDPERIAELRQLLSGRTDPEAIALREKLDSFELYGQMHMPDPDKYNAAFNQADQAHARPTSRFQRLDDHYLLCELVQHLNSAAHLVPADYRQQFLETLSKMTVVTAPMGRCNAFVIRDPKTSQSGIIIDDEIMRVSVQIGFLIARLVELDGRQIIWDTDIAIKRISHEPDIVQHYFHTIMGFLSQGTSRLAPPLHVDQPRQEVMLLFSQLSIIWCICHEMGHVSLGHLDGNGSAMEMLEEIELDSIDTDIDREVAADTYADIITSTVCKLWALDHTPSYAAGTIILSVYHSVFQTLCTLSAPSLDNSQYTQAIREYSRHPSPEERLIARTQSYQHYEQQSAMQFLNAVFDHLNAHLLPFCTTGGPIYFHPRWSRFLSTLHTTR